MRATGKRKLIWEHSEEATKKKWRISCSSASSDPPDFSEVFPPPGARGTPVSIPNDAYACHLEDDSTESRIICRQVEPVQPTPLLFTHQVHAGILELLEIFLCNGAQVDEVVLLVLSYCRNAGPVIGCVRGGVRVDVDILGNKNPSHIVDVSVDTSCGDVFCLARDSLDEFFVACISPDEGQLRYNNSVNRIRETTWILYSKVGNRCLFDDTTPRGFAETVERISRVASMPNAACNCDFEYDGLPENFLRPKRKPAILQETGELFFPCSRDSLAHLSHTGALISRVYVEHLCQVFVLDANGLLVSTNRHKAFSRAGPQQHQLLRLTRGSDGKFSMCAAQLFHQIDDTRIYDSFDPFNMVLWDGSIRRQFYVDSSGAARSLAFGEYTIVIFE